LFISPIALPYFETEHFKIEIDEHCVEKDPNHLSVDCDNVSYVGVRKKDNATIHLTGKTMNNSGTHTYQGFEFHKGKVSYYIYDQGEPTLVITQGDKTLLSEKGEWIGGR